MTHDQALAALAHWYAATWIAPTAEDLEGAHVLPPELREYIDGIDDGRDSLGFFREAHTWAKRIIADFQRSHLRVAARLSRPAPKTDIPPRQTWQTGALE